jgi:2-methylcitrate dehydratase PrpD
MESAAVEEILADYLHDLSFDDLPEDVVDIAAISVVDAVGCAFAGYKLPSSQIAFKVWEQTRGTGKATLWINGIRGNEESTAWTNCLMVHSILQDDTLESTVGHMGSIIIPTVYAVAEERGISGKDFLTAIVAAYEVAGKLSLNTGDAIVSRGFRGSPIFGTFAAATAMGKLLNLSKDEFRSAIALAGNFSCGLLQASHKGSLEWRFQNGAALKNGMMAARLAKNGLSAAEESLEGKFGFYSVFGGPDMSEEVRRRRGALSDSLGTAFEIRKNFYKPCPTCGYNQAGVEVVLALVEKYDICPEDIERIDVAVQPENARYPGGSYKGPFKTIDQALLSKPFSIAGAIKYRTLTVDRYLSNMNEPEIIELANKVNTRAQNGMDYLDAEIEMTMKNGDILKGNGDLVDKRKFFLDKEHAKTKFCYLTANAMNKEDALAILASIYDLPKHNRINPISDAIRDAVGLK